LRKYSLAVIPASFILMLLLSSAPAARADFTTHQGMVNRLAALSKYDAASGGNRLKVSVIGSSVRGRSIVMAQVCDPKADPSTVQRLFVICRQHGDEPATTEAMLNLIEILVKAQDDSTKDILSKVAFFIVPMVNPDGADAFTRRNANNADLNRDWLKLSQPETKSVRAAIDKVNPDAILDEHELSPGNMHNDYVETSGPSCGAPDDVVRESQHLEALVIGMLAVHHMPVTCYKITDQCPARLAHRYFAIRAHKICILFETRQSGARNHQLDYRMNYHIIGTMTVAKYLAGRQDELVARISQQENIARKVGLLSSDKGR